MTGTTIIQGEFVSAGLQTTLSLPMGVDWIELWNVTAINANTASKGKYYYAQFINGALIGTGFEVQTNAGANATNLIAAPASSFALVNTATATAGAPVAITAISNATPPLVSTGSTTGLASNNGVVEIINTTGAQQFGGMTFSIGTVVANTSFTLKYAPTIVAGTNGFYRIIPYDPIFYPRNRFITAITTGATTDIKMSVDSTFTVGQLVRIIVPAAYGSISQNINGLTAVITAINATTNVATVNLNSTGMGTFVFPLTAAVPFTQAQLVPVGSGAPDAGETSYSLLDATENRAISGVTLAAGGVNAPAGEVADVICWRAGASLITSGSTTLGAFVV